MRSSTFVSPDFNRMLVASVFLHCALLLWTLYLPRAEPPPKIVIPPLMFSMIDVAEQPGKKGKAAGRRPAETAPPKPVEVVTQPPAPPQRLEVDALAAKLKEILAPPAPKKAAEKKLKPVEKKARETPPEKKAPPAPRPELHESIKELEKLKADKKSALEELAELKKTPPKKTPLTEERIEEKKPAAKGAAPIAPPKPVAVTAAKPKETAAKAKKARTAAQKAELQEIMKGLEELKRQQDIEEPAELAEREPEKKKPAAPADQAFDKIESELASLSNSSQGIEIQVESRYAGKTDEFTSSLRQQAGLIKGAERLQPDSGGGKGQRASADVLSAYVAQVREKIYGNWKAPLGSEHQKKIIVMFHLFSEGNIDKPFIKQSSGVENLDALAVRAILDSAPLPKFPVELREANLHITIHFTYSTQ